MHAIQVTQHGGPDVLAYRELPTPRPGKGEALVRVRVAGVNYVDVYYRTGRYAQSLPFTPGVEAVGVVEALGEGVTEVAVGDRVAYVLQQGSYAELAVVPAWKLVPVPNDVEDRVAAAAMLQGMTAHFLVHSTYPVKRGETALIHAAAGGVGLLLTQMARRLGARVIATVSTEEKAQLARDAGADDVILYTRTDFESETRRLTGGAGVSVVYDSVGKTTFDKSLNCLRPRGYMVLFGQASGPVAPIDPNILNRKGSLFLTRPSLAHYVSDRETLLSRARDVFGWIRSGELKVRAQHAYPLAQAEQAHRDLEARRTTGKVVLVVAE
jgi:NADPH2:quinone reductase